MIIVGQNKEMIINFDNIQNVRIEPYGTHIKGKKIYKIFAGNFEGYASELGTYETEERAKEVLREIIRKYESSTAKLGKNYISLEYEFVYKMPEE